MTDTPETASREESEDSSPDIPPPSLVGEVISGRYRIEAELGVGGMGAVYRAEHTLMRKRVAIKVLHPEMTRLPEVVARFEREAMAAAHIEHPNVAAATDFGKLDDGSFFLVLEYVEGQSLRDVIGRGPVEPSRAVHISRQIAAALVRAHGLGIVHRDLKPENVMLVERDGDKDFAKVLDFGIAKVPTAQFDKRKTGGQQKTLTRMGMVYGTPEYMAPEQALGQEVDARADLYALGIILYEMLVGRRPFESDNPVTLLGMQVTKSPPLFQDVAPDLQIPGELEALVMELLEKEAGRRPSDARQTLEALEQLEPYLRVSAPSAAALRASRSGVANAATQMALRGSADEAESLRRLPGGSALRELWLRLEPWLERVREQAQRIDVQKLRAELNRVHGKLPSRLRVIPPLVLAATVVGLSLAVMLSGITLFCLSRPPEEARVMLEPGVWLAPTVSSAMAAQADKPTDDELQDAVAKGPEALEALAAKFPTDPRPIKLLGRLYMVQLQPTKALDAYRRLFKLDPKMLSDSEVQENVALAATRPESEDYAFQIMEREMGSQGVDVLYRLAFESKGKSAKATARAARSLKTDAIRKKASKAALVALDLRAAGSCESKYKLLDRAREEGDARTLVQLRPLFSNTGCGFLGIADCWKCMRRSSLLADTVKAIEERTKGDAQ